jgi:hypothetical protein
MNATSFLPIVPRPRSAEPPSYYNTAREERPRSSSSSSSSSSSCSGDRERRFREHLQMQVDEDICTPLTEDGFEEEEILGQDQKLPSSFYEKEYCASSSSSQKRSQGSIVKAVKLALTLIDFPKQRRSNCCAPQGDLSFNNRDRFPAGQYFPGGFIARGFAGDYIIEALPTRRNGRQRRNVSHPRQVAAYTARSRW